MIAASKQNRAEGGIGLSVVRAGKTDYQKSHFWYSAKPCDHYDPVLCASPNI